MSDKDKEEKKSEEENQGNKSTRPLYDKYKKDLEVSEFIMKKAINSVDSWVIGVENQRNYKMKCDFDNEKEFKLAEQNEIKNQIEELSNDSANEQLIQYFTEKIAQQQNLYNKYDEMNNNILAKIKQLKEVMPYMDQRVKFHNEELKKYNKENLKLMDQISKLESEINYQSSIIENNNIENNFNIDPSYNDNIISNRENNMVNSKSQNSINLNEIVEENNGIRNLYEEIVELKKIFKNKKKENLNLLKNITEMNTETFSYKKMFNEGMHEISKELLKLHELQLDKVINNAGENNANSNSIYFEMVKSSGNGDKKKNDDTLKLPIINSNIVKKYKFPVTEKRTPETLIFNVIKKMLDESHNLNKVINLKKNKFSWEEFKQFSAYQIFTILNLNKDVVKRLENYIFPNIVAVPNDFK